MTKSPPEVLAAFQRLKSLFSTPENWCQESFAIDATGEEVQIYAPEAVRWCLIGGANNVSSSISIYVEMLKQLESTLRKTPMLSIPEKITLDKFNDSSTFPEVIDLIDKTIARIEAQGAPQ